GACASTTRGALAVSALEVDLFAGGLSGWTVAARQRGHDPIGIEHAEPECQSRALAGYRTIRADVASLKVPQLEGVAASPPCTASPPAGKLAGPQHGPALADAASRGDWTARPDPDPLVWLVLEPLRWVIEGEAEWLCMEQVRGVLPVWEGYRHWLIGQGWS